MTLLSTVAWSESIRKKKIVFVEISERFNRTSVKHLIIVNLHLPRKQKIHFAAIN